MTKLHLTDPKGFQILVNATRDRLKLDNATAKPLAGTDITGVKRHQYDRLAIVTSKFSSVVLHKRGDDDYDVEFKPGARSFMCFVESSWLRGHIHDILKSPDWMRDGQWDNRWNYIEEIVGDPRTEPFGQYNEVIPATEHFLWIAIYEFLVNQGAFQKCLKVYTDKNFGLPKED